MRDAAAGTARAALESAREAERLGNWIDAERAFSAAFRIAVSERNVTSLVDSLRGSARVRRHNDDIAASDELAELCIAIAEMHGLSAPAARALNTIATNRFLTNRLDEARSIWEECVERLVEAGDGAMAGAVCQNLGAVATITGDLEEAQSRYLECIAASARVGEMEWLGGTYNNLTILCTALGDYAEAIVYNDRGIEVAERRSDRRLLARLTASRAEPLILQGRFETARATLERAEELAIEVDDREIRSVIFRYRSMLARHSGDLDVAQYHVGQALELAAASGSRLQRAEALAEAAYVQHGQNRSERSSSLLKEAIAAFDALGARRDVDRLSRMLEVWKEKAPARRG